jgi:hypothetical protein
MNPYILTIELKNGQIITECIYADSLKEAKQIAKQYDFESPAKSINVF